MNLGLVLALIGFYFWHIWKSIQIEEAFEKRYDEAESYWSDLHRTYKGDLNLAKARIAKLEAENEVLRNNSFGAVDTP